MKLWRHVKSDGCYWEVCRAFNRSLEHMVVYKERYGDTVWVRVASEFDDGRFVLEAMAEGEFPAVFPLHGIFEADLSPCVIVIENDDYMVWSKDAWDADVA